MTKSKISHSKLALPLYIQRAEEYSKRGFLFTTFVFLVLVAWQHYGTMPPGFYVLLAVCVLLQLFVLVHLMTFVATTWHLRKQHSSTMLTALKNDLHHDAKFITELWTFDKATLAYGLLQYRHRWSFLEGRVAVIAGELRKLGLFPALAAVSLSAATLLKEDSNLFLWVPVIAAACIYLVALDALVSLERPQQVIQLLEYAIQHAGQCNANSSEANQ
jgi:hypothetical protein